MASMGIFWKNLDQWEEYTRFTTIKKSCLGRWKISLLLIFVIPPTTKLCIIDNCML
jgi:hypothetical protein